jgi:hypothetical protein
VTTAEEVAFHGETAPLLVGQEQSSGTVHRTEDAILLERVVNDRLLVSIDPAREQLEEEGELGRQRVHGRSLPQRRAPFNGCEMGHRAPSQWAEIPEAKASDRFEGQCRLRSDFGRLFAHHDLSNLWSAELATESTLFVSSESSSVIKFRLRLGS